jgi:inositol phosphorylceramide mannosyltransferase catalytic subunit
MIEKNIFQTWYTTDLHPEIKKKINYIRNLNPEYSHYLFSDNDIDMFVNENYKGEIADAYNKLNIIVAKVDFWRYLVLYKYGGIYLDMDSSIEKPLNTLISDSDEAIITAEGNPNLYVQWALIFSKEHPILKKTIELVVDNINNNKYPNNILQMTGPHVYSRAIYEVYKGIINHYVITKETDITFKTNNVSCRLFGVDYNDYFCFKYNEAYYLYFNKKHWRDDEKEKNLLK